MLFQLLFGMTDNEDQGKSQQVLLKSIVSLVETQKTIRAENEKLIEKSDYLTNVKDEIGMVKLGEEADELNHRAIHVAIREQAIIGALINNYHIDYHLN